MTTQNRTITTQVGPFTFIRWSERLEVEAQGRFRLERQDFDADDDLLTYDWGVWDTLTEDWAHPQTGYARKQQALDAFLGFVKEV